METLRRIEIRRNKIALDYPLYGYHLMMMELLIDDTIPTACTNGKYIKFNTAFVNSLSEYKLTILILHEVKHVIFLHHVRRANREFGKWNEACDYTINWSMKHEDGLTLIEGMLYNEDFGDASAEQNYNKIEGDTNGTRYATTRKYEDGRGDTTSEDGEHREGDEKTGKSDNTGEEATDNTGPDDRKDNNEPNEGVIGEGLGDGDKIGNEENRKSYNNFGDVVDCEDNPIEETERVNELTSQAIKYAEHAGKLPALVKRRVEDLLKPEIPWERLLANWLDSKAQEDFSWLSRDNRIRDYYFPALEDESLGKIGISIDVSGSINNDLLNKFVVELNGLRRKYKFDTVILTVNTRITSVHKFNREQEIKLKIYGGGGTRFKPAFDYFKEEDRDIIGMIYFTDMYSSDLPSIKIPSFSVLWMDYGRGTTPPFGRHIHIRR